MTKIRASDELMVIEEADVCVSTKVVSSSHHCQMMGLTASMRILPTSLLLLLFLPVGQTASNHTYLPQVSVITSRITISNWETRAKMFFQTCYHLASLKHHHFRDILTTTFQPSVRHVSTACCQHSLVASMASVVNMMVNVNVHRDGLESIA